MTIAHSPNLSAADMLEIWEHGAARHPIDRSLLVLQYVSPDSTDEELSRWTIGKRDRRLLEIRRNTFGNRIQGYAECPACQGDLEFELSCERILAQSRPRNSDRKSVNRSGVQWEVRAPNSRDLAVVAAAPDLATARAALLARCVRPVNETAQAQGLPEDIPEAALAEDMATLDPLSEIVIDFTCQACGHAWQCLFDIATFLWREIRARARRHLQEIDLLARTYGWSEGEILRLGDHRRSLYIQMAMS
jgi:hypothetical protein